MDVMRLVDGVHVMCIDYEGLTMAVELEFDIATGVYT